VRETKRGERDETTPPSAGFEAFFEAEYDRLFGTMALATGDRAEAEDITQEAFLRVWLRWERVRAAASPTAYLYRTAFNVLRNRVRGARRAARRLLARDRSQEPTVDAMAESEERTVLLSALRTLQPRTRMALVLTELLGLSSEEAGRLMGVRAATVRSLASRGREQVRRRIGEADG
jgi:RNA polymerase sigma-70 factor (ECF subfamily)